jgi:predicted nucleotidyltransferase
MEARVLLLCNERREEVTHALYNCCMIHSSELYQRLKIKPDRLRDICQQWKITELALFGSVLRDDFNARSDIDILVSFDKSITITFFDLDILEEQLSRLFNRPVDLVTRRAVEQSHNWIRKQNILDNSRVIYEQRSRNTIQPPISPKLGGL